ncbi:hypothetical protein [Streptomyces sp. R41]|uniref:Uncharacterized protein n=1 Tax=Streptomyces sp. R41 TaxID=3238632 RepID=A0AB39R5I1_9ACTN
MPTTPSPQQPRPFPELRVGGLRRVINRLPHRLPALLSRTAGPCRTGESDGRGQRYRRRVKALLWRAALGAAYAIGAVTIAVRWVVASL